VDFTIQQVLIPGESGYETVDVQVVQGRIAAIAPQLPPLSQPVDGRQKLLLPGFVNAHTHSSEVWQRGSIEPLPLELWLAKLYDGEALEPEHIYWSAVATAVETLLSGGTTVVDHLALIPGREMESLAAAVRGYQAVGVRAYIGPLLQDQPLVTSIPTGEAHRVSVDPGYTRANLEILQVAVQQFHRPQERISIMAAPTGAQLCSDAFLTGMVEMSDRNDLCRHTHLLESKAQSMLAYETYGCSAVQHLQRLGFLGPRASFAHCVWLDDADIAIMAETGSTVVHNPLSNLRLGSGIAPLLKYRQAGVNVTFGCDGSASNDSQDLLEAIKIGTILHNTTDFEYRRWITPREAVEMAALGGATGLGMAAEWGSLSVGKQADLVLYDLTSLSLLPRTDPVGMLVLGRPVQAVDSVWVGGDRVVAAGNPCKIDLGDLRQQLWQRSYWQPNQPSASFAEFEPIYRLVMGL
jgi:5-methylthioadenosine/S-adenosylhomocysteine deaminase